MASPYGSAFPTHSSQWDHNGGGSVIPSIVHDESTPADEGIDWLDLDAHSEDKATEGPTQHLDNPSINAGSEADPPQMRSKPKLSLSLAALDRSSDDYSMTSLGGLGRSCFVRGPEPDYCSIADAGTLSTGQAQLTEWPGDNTTTLRIEDESPFTIDYFPTETVVTEQTSSHFRSQAASQTAQKATPKKRKNSEGRMFSCELCGATLTTRQNLTYHKSAHLGTRDYVCGKCNKRFTTPHVRTRHENRCRGLEVPNM